MHSPDIFHILRRPSYDALAIRSLPGAIELGVACEDELDEDKTSTEPTQSSWTNDPWCFGGSVALIYSSSRTDSGETPLLVRYSAREVVRN